MITYAPLLPHKSCRFWVALVFIPFDQEDYKDSDAAKFHLNLINEIEGLGLKWTTHYCPPNFTTEHISIHAYDVPVIMERVKKIPGFAEYLFVRGLLYPDIDPGNCKEYDLFTIPRASRELDLIKEYDEARFRTDLLSLPVKVETFENLYYYYYAGYFDRMEEYKKEVVYQKLTRLMEVLGDQIRGKGLKILY